MAYIDHQGCNVSGLLRHGQYRAVKTMRAAGERRRSGLLVMQVREGDGGPAGHTHSGLKKNSSQVVDYLVQSAILAR